jgi:hypothetical protein
MFQHIDRYQCIIWSKLILVLIRLGIGGGGGDDVTSKQRFRSLEQQFAAIALHHYREVVVSLSIPSRECPPTSVGATGNFAHVSID